MRMSQQSEKDLILKIQNNKLKYFNGNIDLFKQWVVIVGPVL